MGADMMRRTLVWVAGVVVLAGCGAGVSPTATQAPDSGAVTAIVGTATPSGVVVTPTAVEMGTATGGVVSTLVPQGGRLSVSELKYKIFESLGEPQHCDPDMYPVATADEGKVAMERFPEVQKNSEEFGVILRKLSLDTQATLTPEQKLQVYREHKKLDFGITLTPQGADYGFQLVAGASPKGVNKFDGMITSSGAISVSSKQPTVVNCPICLAGDTLIDTPGGPVEVRKLRQGMAVWTVDASGAQRAAVILKTAKREVALTHQMVRLVLSDGRSLFVSPAHPAVDGRLIGTLSAGDSLDGARVVTAERVPYIEAATYDILPSGETGDYRANGILVGSTLARGRGSGPACKH